MHDVHNAGGHRDYPRKRCPACDYAQHTIAHRYVVALQRSTDEYYAEVKSDPCGAYERFTERQRKLWDDIVAAGDRVNELVLEALRA